MLTVEAENSRSETFRIVAFDHWGYESVTTWPVRHASSAQFSMKFLMADFESAVSRGHL